MIWFRSLPSFVIRAAELGDLGGPDKDVATIGSLETLFSNAVNVVIALAGVALFLMLIVSGFSYLFSGGDQKKLEQAKGTVTNAIIGLVVIVSAYLIIKIIGAFTGVPDLTIFEIIQN